MGTMLQRCGFQDEEVPELLNLSHPDVLEDIHRQYIAAGSQAMYANTFGANRYKLAGTGKSVAEVIQQGIAIAKRAAQGTETKVLLDIGPLGQLLEPMGSLSFEEAYDAFAEMVRAGNEADGIVIETVTDLQEARAALLAAKENSKLPVLVTMSFEPSGRTFTGCSVESMAMTLEGLGADAIGVNCSAGPDLLMPVIERLCKSTNLPVAAKPNAGLPNPIDGSYSLSPEVFGQLMEACVNAGVSIVGGCCGTSPAFIEQLHKRFSNRPVQAKTNPKRNRVCTSVRPLYLDSIKVVGERINPTGKKRFQQALLEEDLEYIASLALAQQDAGADLLDVNVGYPGVDEVKMLPAVVKAIARVCDLPLVLDSSNPKALEAALRIYCGKALVNSVNGKEESMDVILPLAAKYGASVVALCLDEDGIPDSAKKRTDIAKKIVQRAKEYGIGKEDLVADALTLTVSAQQDQAKETLQAIRQITKELGIGTILGVSNISFGLPARTLIAKTFLVQAMEEGLKLAIVNPNQSEMMDVVDAFRVLSGQDAGSVRYIEKHGGVQESVQTNTAKMSLDQAVYKGLGKEAAQAAEAMLAEKSELEIVQDALIPALDAVGSAYELGKLFLPQLLAAANAAQAVFEVLKTSLAQKGEKQIVKGRIVMATVQGDVHDIGKNIVKTVLENYGYEVIDLGKDVAPEKVVETVQRENIELVGLSALMTTTLEAMERTTELLKQLPNPPAVMVGGAVLTPEFAEKIGAIYSKDANDGVRIAREVFGQ
jgi:5-methyltetrahydrofolate--homocysteine methyltransferase